MRFGHRVVAWRFALNRSYAFRLAAAGSWRQCPIFALLALLEITRCVRNATNLQTSFLLQIFLGKGYAGVHRTAAVVSRHDYLACDEVITQPL